MLNFRRLDAYTCAISFFKLSLPFIEHCPSGYHSLADQLRRAAVSIPLNIAEGSGKFSKEERRYFMIARGSALECAAIIDVLESLGAVVGADANRAPELLERIVAMLTKLAGAR